MVIADQPLDAGNLLLFLLLDDLPSGRRELGDPALDGLVVLVGAQVREVVIPAMDDPRVALAVIRVDDDVDATDLCVRDPVDDRTEVLDLDVVEGARRGRVVLVEASDLASLPTQLVRR